MIRLLHFIAFIALWIAELTDDQHNYEELDDIEQTLHEMRSR